MIVNQSGRDTELEADVTALEVLFTFYSFF